MIRKDIIGILTGILLLSSCNSEVYYTLPVGDRLLQLCKEVVVERDGEVCIPSDRVEIKISVTVSPPPKKVKIENPKEFVRFTLPKRGLVCYKNLITKCKEVKADKSFWLWYFLEEGNQSVENTEKAEERFNRIKSIIEALNQGIEKGEISVQARYDSGIIVFMITLPKKYVVLLKKYMDIANIPIGVEADTPFGSRTTYYELTY